VKTGIHFHGPLNVGKFLANFATILVVSVRHFSPSKERTPYGEITSVCIFCPSGSYPVPATKI
jgi:hypothetical protein